MSNYAYVTLLFNDSYLPGALTLVESLKIQGTKYPIVLLYASLSDDVLEHLKRSNIFDELINIDDNLLKSNSDYHLNDILGRSDLNYTLTKLNCWNLTKFDKVIYLDLDLLILQSLDSIFDDVSINENQLAASPDSGWPDLFNSGLFLIKPSPIIFKKLLDLYSTTPSFDGADQGLLNDFFNGENWIRLPFIYNCTLSSNYEYFPALLKFISQVKTIHFIGSNKPWKSTNINTDYKLHVPNKGFKSFHELWWDVYKTTSLNELDYLDVLRLSGHLQPAPNQKLRPPPQQQEAKINKKETLTHHTYYYKIPESVPKPYDSDKGEAYMLNEPKSNNQWNTTAPVSTTTNKSKSLKKKKHLSKEELYVQSHPIFPFEKQQGRNGVVVNLPTRQFNDLNFTKYIPSFEPILDLASSVKMDTSSGETTTTTKTSKVDNSGKFIAGFDDPGEFDSFLRKMENMERPPTYVVDTPSSNNQINDDEDVKIEEFQQDTNEDDDLSKILDEKLKGVLEKQ